MQELDLLDFNHIRHIHTSDLCFARRVRWSVPGRHGKSCIFTRVVGIALYRRYRNG
ncbi:hypothetical protein BH18ACI4_BH18ACI4_19840 [soil metagenome]